jgi:protein-disulfide isomerase
MKFRHFLACMGMLIAALGVPARAASQGPADAPISIVVFSAYTCPYCADGQLTLAQLLARYPGQIHITYKHFPLGKDAAAWLPHQAAQAAAEQGRFLAMHEALFARQGTPLDRPALLALAASLKLDVKRFSSALDRPSLREAIGADIAEAQAYKVSATPTFYIEGYKFEGLHQAAVFEQIIDHKLGTAARSGGAQ